MNLFFATINRTGSTLAGFEIVTMSRFNFLAA